MEELQQFVEQMRATSSSLEKVEILKKQSDFIKKVLEYTYNPYKQFTLLVKHVRKTSTYAIQITYIIVYLTC